MATREVKGFEKIFERNKVLGLEFFDLLALILIYLVLFSFSSHLIVNLFSLFGAYLVLRFYKRGKPAHWLESLFLFLLRPRTYSPARELKSEVFGE